MNDQEQHIITLLKQRDRRSIEMLYELYAPALFGIALKIVRSDQVAEDVVQEVFVKVWKNGSKYHPSKGRLFTWLLNITRNTAIDQTRSASYQQGKRLQRLDGPDGAKARLIVQPRPEYIGLRDLVEGLDNRYKEVIDLIYFQGFTQQEVTEELNIPLGTVKSRTRIAIRELRKFFESKKVGLIVILGMFLN